MQKGSFCTCCTGERGRRGARELFISGSENYAKGKLLYLLYWGEGEERNKGICHPM
jgi:hypothetical protein